MDSTTGWVKGTLPVQRTTEEFEFPQPEPIQRGDMPEFQFNV